MGSAGQPKRVIRPKRKGLENGASSEAPPGASIMRLPNGPGSAAGTPARMGPSVPGMAPGVNSTPVPIPPSSKSRHQAGGVPSANQASGVQIRPALQGAPNMGPGLSPVASSIKPPPPPGAMRQIGGPGGRPVNTAPTPPDESNGAIAPGQKRYASMSGEGAAASTPASKRRRTEGSISAAGATRNRNGSQAGLPAIAAGAARSPSDALVSAGGGPRQAGAVGGGAAGSNTLPMSITRADGIAGMVTDVLSKFASAATLASATRWPEQAMEIFFQEFADEDMDLQLRIAEKILTDTNKAVMFCKMPAALRKHWVKRLREAISRQGT